MALFDQFDNERAAEAALESLLAPYFRLVRQVWLQHYTGKRLRIDYVAVPLVSFPAPLVGIEVKAGYGRGHDFLCALHQARDYRHCTIVDKRATRSAGLVLPFVFIFPAPNELAATTPTGAVLRLAGLGRVGSIHQERYGGLCFRVSAERLWSSAYGERADATGWGTRLQVGSR